MTDYKRLRDENEAMRAAIVADIAAHPDTTAAEIIERLGIGKQRAFSLLGNAKKKREIFCWNEYNPDITHWRTTPYRPPKKVSPAKASIGQEDLDWMAYWQTPKPQRSHLQPPEPVE